MFGHFGFLVLPFGSLVFPFTLPPCSFPLWLSSQAIDVRTSSTQGFSLTMPVKFPSSFSVQSLWHDLLVARWFLHCCRLPKVRNHQDCRRFHSPNVWVRLGFLPLLTVMVDYCCCFCLRFQCRCPGLVFLGLIQPILKNLEFDHPFCLRPISPWYCLWSKHWRLGFPWSLPLNRVSVPIQLKPSSPLPPGSCFRPVCIVSRLLLVPGCLRSFPWNFEFQGNFPPRLDEKSVSAGKIIYILLSLPWPLSWVCCPGFGSCCWSHGYQLPFSPGLPFGAGLLGKDDFTWILLEYLYFGCRWKCPRKSSCNTLNFWIPLVKLSAHIGGFNYLSVMAIFLVPSLLIYHHFRFPFGRCLRFHPNYHQIRSKFRYGRPCCRLSRFGCLFHLFCRYGHANFRFPQHDCSSLQDRKGRYVSTRWILQGWYRPSIIFAASIVGSVALLGGWAVNKDGSFTSGGH